MSVIVTGLETWHSAATLKVLLEVILHVAVTAVVSGIQCTNFYSGCTI